MVAALAVLRFVIDRAALDLDLADVPVALEIGGIVDSVIALSLIASGIAFFLLPSGAGDPGVTVVEAPEQTKAQRPACFPDPEANYIPMPETENLAVGKPISSGEHTDVYVAANVNDGKTDT